jgi:hypothetical protein
MKVEFFLFPFLFITICPIISVKLFAEQFARTEVKALKSLVRNIIAPTRDLGHTDRALKKEEEKRREEKAQGQEEQKKECDDCS